MKIKETYVSFIGEINVGRLAFFIYTDKNGVEINIDSLIENSQNFSKIVFLGDVLEQKNELSIFIKKIVKLNPNVSIEIETYGTIKPTGITTYKNIIYNVNVRLKNTNIDYNKRYDKNILTWLSDADSNFLFYVIDDECIDEANSIIRDVGIKKNKVFLANKDEATKEILDFLIKKAKTNNYNFSLNYKKTFWPEIGRF